jgi:hypothetical protein
LVSRLDNIASANIVSRADVADRAVRFHDQEISPFDGEAVIKKNAKKLLVRQAVAKQIEGKSLQRMITSVKRSGQSTDPELALARIGEFYDKLPNMPERAALIQLIKTIVAYQQEMRREKTKASERQLAEEDEEDDEEGVESPKGRRDRAFAAISSALGQFDSDVSHQSAAFDLLKDALDEEEDIDPDFQAALGEVEYYYDQTVGMDVRAGYAAAKAANDSAATLSTNPGAIRETYRALLRMEKSTAKLLDALKKYDPLKKLDAVIDLFSAIVGADLSNLTGPSTEPILLRSLFSELGKLKKLRTVLDGCLKLVENVEAALPDDKLGALKADEVASGLLHFIALPNPSMKQVYNLLGPLAT